MQPNFQMALRRTSEARFLELPQVSNGPHLTVGWLPSSGCSEVTESKMLQWTLTVPASPLGLKADLGQVFPFNASVPHLSNGVITLTYLMGCCVRHYR